MLRGGPQTSDNSKQQLHQKQKKRLSFKDPEVEGPQKNSFHGGCRSKTLVRPTTNRQKVTTTRKLSSSVEDLTLEALHIAQHVGSAFSDLIVSNRDIGNIGKNNSISTDFEKETEIIDSSPSGESYSQRNRDFRISVEDEQFLDSLVPPLLDPEIMRGPSVENSDADSTRNCIPMEEPSLRIERSTSSSTQHQIQLLQYQLEQQNQQMQMAMHQIQFFQQQMDAESVARRKAQEQNNQLMQQNKELLIHIEKLFQQIEELEKQVRLLEQEKRSKRTIANHEPQAVSTKQPTISIGYRRSNTEQTHEKSTSSIGYRRPSTEHAYEKSTSSIGYRKPSNEQIEKPAIPSRTSYATARKNSLTLTKPVASNPKLLPPQNSTTISTNRKTPVLTQRPYGGPIKNSDSGAKPKETLRIGDTSPPVQSGTLNSFGTAWKLTSSEESNETSTDKLGGSNSRSRAGSFSTTFVKKPQETKSTLFSSSFSSTGATNKKYSSSTSDLYNSPSTFQGKSSLMIEEPPAGVKSAVSNLSLSSTSKLPRYQPYTGWQRRTSLTNDTEPISAINKDSYKNTSLFNR